MDMVELNKVLWIIWCWILISIGWVGVFISFGLVRDHIRAGNGKEDVLIPLLIGFIFLLSIYALMVNI